MPTDLSPESFARHLRFFFTGFTFLVLFPQPQVPGNPSVHLASSIAPHCLQFCLGFPACNTDSFQQIRTRGDCMSGLGEVPAHRGSPLSQSPGSALLVRHKLGPFSGRWVPQRLTLDRIHSTLFAAPKAPGHPPNSCASSVLTLPL